MIYYNIDMPQRKRSKAQIAQANRIKKAFAEAKKKNKGKKMTRAQVRAVFKAGASKK